jgi:Tfp pilus assembly protein PilW
VVGEFRGAEMVELLVALAITLLVTSAVFAMLDPAAGAFQVQPEAADTLQRLRAATDVLRRDVLGAGSGPSTALSPNPSTLVAAAIFPARIGRRSPDAAGTFNDTALSFWSVSSAEPQAALAVPLEVAVAVGGTSVGVVDAEVVADGAGGVSVGLGSLHPASTSAEETMTAIETADAAP